MADESVVTAPGSPAQPPYFAVGIVKLAVLSVVSLGFYELYWFYQQWKHECDRTGDRLNPVARAVFAPLFAYSLFVRVEKQLVGDEFEDLSSAGFMAFAFFALTAAGHLPDPYWLVGLLAFLPLLPVQVAINRLNGRRAPEAPRNTRFTRANFALIVLGSLALGLVVLGLLVQEPLASPPMPDSLPPPEFGPQPIA